MIARVGSGVVFALAAYVVPLIGSPALADPRVWIAMVGAFALVTAQPTLSRDDVREDASTDRWTGPLIMIVALVGQILAALELRWLHLAASAPQWGVGLAAIVGGSGLRVLAIRALGRWFTGTVRVVGGQAVVMSGPYRWIRHPSYLGALIAILGVPILFGAWGALVFAAVSMIAVYRRRIVLEEAALAAALGEPYRGYRSRTWALVPGVW